MPPIEVVPARSFHRWRDVNEKHFDSDRDGTKVLVEIHGVVEVKLLHHRTPLLTVRSQGQFKSFADGGFADVVLTDQKSMTIEVEICRLHALKVLNVKPRYFHM